MSEIIHYNQCPVCGSANISSVLQAKDFTASNETFTIFECHSCTFRFTQDVPGATSIAPYYKAESYISHTDSTKGLINRLYHSVRKLTIRQKCKLVKKVTGRGKGNMLDVGAGTGVFVKAMLENGWQVTGLEPDAEARKVAKEVYGATLSSIEDFYHLPDNSFDAITLWHVLEHVHDLKGYMAKLKSLLKESGRLIIAVPNYTSGDAAVYKEFWAAYDVPRHLYHFSPQSMQKLVEESGLRILQYKPMWFDSFYVSMLSSKYKSGKTSLPGAFFYGLKSNFRALGDKKRCSSVIYVTGK
ncbi:MAG: class I SAM-dependent methyltransferase [Chitinophagaceae bacterium]|nr:class I SAM-dependent methyltransferase [Chitinophagaceae bacterium]MBK8951799.1 class I SAM-dependent methyltransferase [Chitinophagaceae bacterium]